MTQEELGVLSGSGQQTIQALESRESKKSAHASKIADALGVNLEWLLGTSEEKHSDSETRNDSNRTDYENAHPVTKRLMNLIHSLSIEQQEALATFLIGINVPSVQDPSSAITPRKKSKKKSVSAS
ncbi:MAG: helix-turn-helix transcriptional regulator [Candidatus Thiodiazotropha sp. (ex Dulcina madagascariensis)]|nr:helix-turn-helix transcriptional regulator [Candidatus Thiodiazotropha sp. (ex Dulcina madagascariensis)]